MEIRKYYALTFLLLTTMLFAQEKSVPQLGKNSVKEVVAAMTLDEKLLFLKGIGMTVSNGENGPVAGNIDGKVIGAAGSTEAILRLGIPAMIVADGPAGLRIEPVKKGNKLNFPTAFPVGTSLASTWNKELVNAVGKAMGNEVLEFGVDVILAPGINIQRNLLCGRNFEYYSEDPVVAGTIAAAFIQGIQSNNVGTSIKHFAVNNQETSRNSIDAVVSQRALREIYLKGFEIAIKKSNPWTVMSSYNKINGTYSSENYDLLTTILRKEWGYQGMVMTDWYAGKNYGDQVKAGNDLLMPGRKQESKKIQEALENKKLTVEEIDRNIERILTTILKTPSFKKYPYSNNPDYVKNQNTAKLAAQEAMILLKNNDNTLPFKSKKIALLGNASYDTFVGGTGSGEVRSAYTVSFFDGFKKDAFQMDADLAKTYQSYIEKEKSLRPKRGGILETIKPVEEMPIDDSELQKLAKESDAALITIGRNAGEGSDRDLNQDYKISEKEISLIKNTVAIFHKQNKKVVVALNIDALIDMTQLENLADAILITWLPGQESGNALVEIVSGKVSPSGKLTQTIPLKYEDVPSSSSFPGTPIDRPKTSIYNEGIYVGYRYYNTFKKPVAYEFGYGLSYSTFKIDNIKTDNTSFSKELKVTVDVKNTGKMSGKEVVQLYISAPHKTLDKPESELKAFAKTKLLKPGESEKISFTIKSSDLSSFDTSRSAWIADAGAYIIKIGNSIKDDKLTSKFTLKNELIVEKVNNVLAPQQVFDELKN